MVSLEPVATTSQAFLAVTDECMAHWQANVDGVLTHRAHESLHQLRVGVRRFRSALVLFARSLDGAQVGWLGAEIRELALPFGPARDLDVLLESEDAPLFPPAALALLKDRRAAAYVDVIGVLESRAWSDAWQLVERFRAQAPWDLNPDPPATSAAALALDRRWRRVLKRGAKLRDLSPTDRHRVRIEAKKLRYGAQFFAGLFPAEGREATPPLEFADAVGGLQDALGRLNDVHTEGLLLRSVGLTPPVVDEDALVTDAVTAQEQVAALTPFWRTPTP